VWKRADNDVNTLSRRRRLRRSDDGKSVADRMVLVPLLAVMRSIWRFPTFVQCNNRTGDAAAQQRRTREMGCRRRETVADSGKV
jgi:hypothetical protein